MSMPAENSNDLQPDSAKLVETAPTPELSSSVETEDERYLVDESEQQNLAVPPVPLHPAPLHPRRQKWLARHHDSTPAAGTQSTASSTSDSFRD